MLVLTAGRPLEAPGTCFAFSKKLGPNIEQNQATNSYNNTFTDFLLLLYFIFCPNQPKPACFWTVG